MTKRRQYLPIVFVLLVICWGTALSLSTVDNDIDDEYVRQVLEDEQQHYGNEYYYDEYRVEDSVYEEKSPHDSEKQDSLTEEERRAAEQERLAREQADRVAAEREQKFQAELERMDEEHKKQALKQKKRDHRRVQVVLRAAKRNDLYGVLGMKNWNIKLPSRSVELPFGSGVSFTIPGVTLKETTEKDIRKNFRIRARQLHPDKNKDGRAQEAFIAAEAAATILSDPEQRAIYDNEMRRLRVERMTANRKLLSAAAKSMWKVSSQVVKATHTVLGPFFTSVMILLALII